MEKETSFENFENKVMPTNHMGLAITGTVLGLCPTLCCVNFILGIVAIYFATQVKKKFEQGDYAGAESASKNAKILSYIAIALFVVGIIISILTYDEEQNREMIEQLREAFDQ